MSNKPKASSKVEDVDVFPDAWERFEHAVDAAVKSGPMHRQRPIVKRKGRPTS